MATRVAMGRRSAGGSAHRGWWLDRMAFTREHRISTWMVCADLLEAGFEIERVLPVVAEAARAAGRRRVGRVVEGLIPALETGEMRAAVARVAPPAEAMVFEGFGRVEASAVFRGAARIAEVQDRVALALRTQLAGPALLVVVIALMLYAAGMWFVPALEDMAPVEEWPVASRLAGEVAVAFKDNVLLIGGGFVGVSGVVAWLARNWTGRGRPVADRFFPFSIVRLVSGLSFVLTVVEAMRAGLELDARLFRGLASGGTRYTRHRIGAIGDAMERGEQFGQAMAGTGHGFPTPELIPVVTALDGTEAWEERLGKFVDRWVARSERLVGERAAVANRVMTGIVVLIAGSGMWLLFGVLQDLIRRGVM